MENLETDKLKHDEQLVGRLLGNLDRVEAPSNFERRVLAKIAEGPKHASRRVFGLSMAVAYTLIPLLVLIAFVAFLIENRLPSHRDEPQVSRENQIAPSAPAAPADNSDIPQNGSDQKQTLASSSVPPEQKYNRPIVTRKPTVVAAKHQDTNRGGGSFERAVKSPNVPSNTSPSSSTPSNRNENMSSSSSRNGLQMMGIFVDQSWVVKRVASNSIGERAGVKPGDVFIGSDFAFPANAVSGSTHTLSAMRVYRDGQVLVLPIK